MKIPGFTMGGAVAGRLSQATSGVELVSGVESEASVYFDKAFFAYHSEQEKHRPYLHIIGEVRELRPESQTLPGNVNAVTFKPMTGVPVDVFYEFSNDQLADLVQRGFFLPNFQFAPELTDSIFDLPVDVDYLVALPEDETQVPLVFVKVQDSSQLVMGEDESGYDMVAFFPTTQPVAADEFEHDDTEAAFVPLVTEDEDEAEVQTEAPAVIAQNSVAEEQPTAEVAPEAAPVEAHQDTIEELLHRIETEVAARQNNLTEVQKESIEKAEISEPVAKRVLDGDAPVPESAKPAVAEGMLDLDDEDEEDENEEEASAIWPSVSRARRAAEPLGLVSQREHAIPTTQGPKDDEPELG